MTIHDCNVINQEICVGPICIPKGNVQTDAIRPSFSEDWAGTSIYAIFAKGGASYSVSGEGGLYAIPAEIMATPGTFRWGFCGYVEDDGAVTLRISTRVQGGIISDGAYTPDAQIPGDVTPQEWERVIAHLTDYFNPHRVTAAQVGAATPAYVDAALAGKQDVLTFDSTPTAGSSNPVTSSGIAAALADKLDTAGGTISGDLTVIGPLGVGSYIGAFGSVQVGGEYPLTVDANYGKITGLQTPTASGDAAPKGYVDTGLAGKQDTLTFDNAPTAGSDNPVKSGGIAAALADKLDTDGGTVNGGLTVIGPLSVGSYLGAFGSVQVGGEHPLTVDANQGKVTGLQTPTASGDAATKGYVDAGLAGKQDTLTFDNAPTAGSDNPVKSGGIAEALADKLDTAGGTVSGDLTVIGPLSVGSYLGAFGSVQVGGEYPLTVDANYGKITGLQTPTASGDAATKGYVDAGLAGKQDTLTFDNAPTAGSDNPVKSGGVDTALQDKFDKTGGTVNGDVTINGDVSIDGEDVSVDSEQMTYAAGRLSLIGADPSLSFEPIKVDANLGTMTGVRMITSEVATGGYLSIKNVKTPTNDWDAVNKKYVDAGISNLDFENETYSGVDLTVKFASEISTAPYSGDPWAWIKARIQAGNFAGIHVCDYIPFVANGNTMTAQVAGINSYKGYGDTEVGNHIDFISRELWPVTKAVNAVNWNNGLIPIETVTTDGTTTVYTLTKQMDSISNVKQNNVVITGWAYNQTTYTLTFTTAPAAGSIVVTGTGTESPWLASDLYLWLNSMSGHIANDTAVPPTTAIKRVDYTDDGVYNYLPQNLKDVIVEKRYYGEKRYSNSSLRTSSNTAGWYNIGKLWLPNEVEICGHDVFSSTPFSIAGAMAMYPIFEKQNNVKRRNSRLNWWTANTANSSSGNWIAISANGNFYSTPASGSSGNVYVPVCFRVG